jgi:hypothetical protein
LQPTLSVAFIQGHLTITAAAAFAGGINTQVRVTKSCADDIGDTKDNADDAVDDASVMIWLMLLLVMLLTKISTLSTLSLTMLQLSLYPWLA